MEFVCFLPEETENICKETIGILLDVVELVPEYGSVMDSIARRIPSFYQSFIFLIKCKTGIKGPPDESENQNNRIQDSGEAETYRLDANQPTNLQLFASTVRDLKKILRTGRNVRKMI